MLTIHHVPGTRGFRVIWLCEEIGLPYQLARVDFSPAYRATPEWRRMNPVGKVPVMTDGEFVLYESGAMLQYLLDRHADGRLQPAHGTQDHGLYLQWSWFAEATFGRFTGELANHKRAFADGPIAAVMEETGNRARLCMQALEQQLEGRTYLLGDEFSAADIMMGYTLRSFDRHVGDAHPPNVAGYWSRLTGRAAYKAAEAADRME